MDEEKLFSLMVVAEEQQAAIETALKAMQEERQALTETALEVRQALADTALEMQQAFADNAFRMQQALVDTSLGMQSAIKKGVPEMRRATQEAASSGVQSSLLGASEAAAEALKDTAKPLLKQMQGVVQAAGVAEKQLSSVTAHFSRRWSIFMGAIAAATIGAVLLSASWLVEKQRVEVSALEEQKTALLADVQQLQANVKTLEAKGGRIKLEHCGPSTSKRLCVEITRNQGKGLESFNGSWHDEYDRQFVIPKGY